MRSLFLILAGWSMMYNPLALIGVALVAALDLRAIARQARRPEQNHVAFFTVNGFVSILFFSCNPARMVVINGSQSSDEQTGTIPTIWLRPLVGGNHEEFCRILGGYPGHHDGGSNPALWGQLILRAKTTEVMSIAGRDIERATSDHQAADFIGAHLIETLSSLQRTYLSFCFLYVRRALKNIKSMAHCKLFTCKRRRFGGIILGLLHCRRLLAATSLWAIPRRLECVLPTGFGIRIRFVRLQPRLRKTCWYRC
ncbi:MAG: hypothetical protein R2688_07295 [Fimbriimonadaceae bacterium]